MMNRKVTSLTNWCRKLQDDDLLAFLIGCTPDFLPHLGSYFDFLDRLWLQRQELQKLGRKELFPASKNAKPSKSPGKNKKLPNRHKRIKIIIIQFCTEFNCFLCRFLHSFRVTDKGNEERNSTFNRKE